MNRCAADFVRTARPLGLILGELRPEYDPHTKIVQRLRNKLWSGGQLAKTLPGPLRSSYWSLAEQIAQR
jgi:hypothetical protein